MRESLCRRRISGLLCALICGSIPALGIDILVDGFESGTICAWSNAPSEFEVPGSGLDEDCDGLFDEAADVCDPGLPSNASDPMSYGAALDLCQLSSPGSPQWGLVAASLTLASGAVAPDIRSRSIRSTFGDANVPQGGVAMVVLSSGAAAAMGQTNPNPWAFVPGLDTLTSSPAPTDWLTANGGVFPAAPGCPVPAGAPTVLNSVMLTLSIRVPDNAHSFSLAASLLTSEYAEYVCSLFNDPFVALLDSAYSGLPANPTDKNLAFFRTPPDLVYPIGASLAFSASGLFVQCQNGVTGCGPGGGGVAGATSTCEGTAGLAGTGMELIDPSSCEEFSPRGGGTDWFVLRGNVQPGELIALRLAIWDNWDGFFDSVVLLDAFRWSVDTVEPGVTRE